MYRKNERITTPVGVAQWPRLNEPDTKFNKDGVYSVGLRLSAEDAQPIVEMLTNALAAHVDKLEKEKKKVSGGRLPSTDVVDQDSNPTGEVEFRFKLNAIGMSGGDRWEQRPALFDSNGKPITETIGGGSKIKIGAEVIPYHTSIAGAGISLRLKAVQVIELVEYTKGDSFDSWSFSKEKGFETSGKEEAATEAVTTGADDSEEFDF